MPRRHHKKSHNGCLTCKKRRVKCPEDGPPCQNCLRKFIECRYAPDHAQRQVPSPPELQQVGGERSQISSTSYAQRHLLELELLHHYTSNTWRTFCHNHQQSEQRQHNEQVYLQITFPREALQHPFTSHALFAISALHMASLSDSDSKARYLQAALQYQSWAQLVFANVIAGPVQPYDSKLFTTSLAFLVLAVAAPRYVSANNEAPIDNILMAYKLFRGSHDILQKFRQISTDHPLFAIHSPKDMIVFNPCESDIKIALERLRGIVKQRYRSRNAAVSNQEGPDLLDELEYCFQRLQAGNKAVALGWLLTMPERFVDDLTNSEQEACLIFLHWCVLLHKTSALWWVPDSGATTAAQLVADLRSKGIDIHSQENQAILWCQEEISAGS